MSRVSKTALLAALVLAATTTSEASAAHHRRGAGTYRGHVEAIIQKMDADQNGRVSKEEFMQFMSSEFDRLDRDRSGELTSEEVSRSAILNGGTARSSPHR